MTTFKTFGALFSFLFLFRSGVEGSSLRAVRRTQEIKFVQRGCTKYNAGNRYDRRSANVPMKEGNAEVCADACRDMGYPFFGFECPMKNKVHCQCYSEKRFGDKEDESLDCKALVGGGGDKHCTGNAMIGGISMGGADIGSIYEVPALELQKEVAVEPEKALAAEPQKLDTTDYVQRGCTKYDAGDRSDRRPLNVPMKEGNAETCAEACGERGFPFFGFECPMPDKVHCQCYAPERIGKKEVESLDCKALVGGGGDKHCTGDAIIGGLSMGGADIGSIYEVPDFVRKEKKATKGFGQHLGQCEGATCSLWGDPHIITCDGLAYDCQGTGLFTLMKNYLYNIQGRFVPFRKGRATITNDVIVEYSPDDDKDDGVPTMQFSFADVSSHDGLFDSEEGCEVNRHYEPLNMLGQGRSVEDSAVACRKRCENTDGCTKFSYWLDRGCHINDETSPMVDTPSDWSRSLSGPLSSTCGVKPEKSNNDEATEELDKSRPFDNRCPLLFYLDRKLQDISNVGIDEYLYGDSTSDHSAKITGLNEILVVHKTGSGAYSEMRLEAAGQPGEIWSCHWNFWVCLPEDDQELFADFSVGLFGSPDGNTQNDWIDAEGNTILIPYENRDRAAFDYCQDNWCVSQNDSLMAYATGTTYADIKCANEDFVEFDVDKAECILSAEKIHKKCDDKPPLLVHSCQIECCFGGCDTFDIIEKEIIEVATLSTFEEDIVYDFPFLPSICNGTTNETACPSSDKGVVTLVSQSADIPEGETVLYGFKSQSPQDENMGRTVKFHVDNPFFDHADIFVRYLKKSGEYAMDPTCDYMPDTIPECDPQAPEIEVGCHEYPGVDPFALVDIYFVSNKDLFIANNADTNTEVDECCYPPDSYYQEDGYGVIRYTFKIECTCSQGEGGNFVQA